MPLMAPARMAAMPPRRGSWQRFAYVSIWMLVGAGSIVFLASSFTARDRIDRLASALFSNSPEAVDDPRFASLASENGQLKVKLTKVETSLASFQQSVTRLDQQRHILGTRLNAIESGKPLTREDISTLEAEIKGEVPAVYSPPNDNGSEIEGTVIDGDRVTPKEKVGIDKTPAKAPEKASKKKSASKDAEGSVEIVKAKAKPVAPAVVEDVDVTGSIEPVKPKAEKPMFGIVLATAADPELLRNKWDLVSQLHPDLLQELVPRAVKTADGETMRLIAGPFASEAKAKAVCNKLAELNQPCHVAGFAGNSL